MLVTLRTIWLFICCICRSGRRMNRLHWITVSYDHAVVIGEHLLVKLRWLCAGHPVWGILILDWASFLAFRLWSIFRASAGCLGIFSLRLGTTNVMIMWANLSARTAATHCYWSINSSAWITCQHLFWCWAGPHRWIHRKLLLIITALLFFLVRHIVLCTAPMTILMMLVSMCMLTWFARSGLGTFSCSSRTLIHKVSLMLILMIRATLASIAWSSIFLPIMGLLLWVFHQSVIAGRETSSIELLLVSQLLFLARVNWMMATRRRLLLVGLVRLLARACVWSFSLSRTLLSGSSWRQRARKRRILGACEWPIWILLRIWSTLRFILVMNQRAIGLWLCHTLVYGTLIWTTRATLRPYKTDVCRQNAII